MRVAVDAMGGDFAPGEIVRGTLLAARDLGAEFVLVGNEQAIRAELPGGKLPEGVTLHNASEQVAMGEKATRALRKQDSSLVVGARLLKERAVDAFFTAGNTGAAVAVALTVVGKLPGIDRAYIAVLMPTTEGAVVLMDGGATVDCKPRHFVEMALMGSVYAKARLKVDSPRIAILNVGEEDAKGSKVVKEAHKLIRQTDLNFLGNTEGDRLFAGECEVILCDGFVGNVALKVAESSVKFAFKLLARELRARPLDRLAGLIIKRSAMKRLARDLDYSAHGGALLLGINGTYVIGHGKSSDTAVHQALRITVDSIRFGVVDFIRESVPREVAGLDKDLMQEDEAPTQG
jgi:glycerol-3-phosphate acyltransferase PlsX